MSDIALVIIDVQKGMFSFPEMQPHGGKDIVAPLNSLIAKARQSKVNIIFVQHQGTGNHPLKVGTELYDIIEELDNTSEDIYIVKTQCGSFHETDLRKTLVTLNVKKLVIGGLQTEFCVDTAIRTAKDYGYEVTAIKDGHTTFDSETLSAVDIKTHHQAIWGQGFAAVMLAQDIEFS